MRNDGLALLDVNALVALAWDSHVHHARIRQWFVTQSVAGWATCPLTESDFVRVSANPRILPSAIGIGDARRVLAALRGLRGHRFLSDDVSPSDPDFPVISGYRQVSDAHLLVLARRRGVPLLTFDVGLATLGGADVELLSVL